MSDATIKAVTNAEGEPMGYYRSRQETPEEAAARVKRDTPLTWQEVSKTVRVEPAPQGRKFDAGKVRFDLLPVRPLYELAKVYTIGAYKYDDRNWETGLAFSRVFRALLSHAYSFWNGETHDAEDGQHHLASVAWCAFALMEFGYRIDKGELPGDLDDRPAAADVRGLKYATPKHPSGA